MLKAISLVRLGSALLQVFGVLWLLVQITAFFSTDLSNHIKEGWWIFLLIGLVCGFIRAWPKKVVENRIFGTDVDVKVRVCDIFSVDGAFVIGCNTTFDTTIEDNTISANSLQGQFTMRYCSSILELDEKIEAGLRGLKPLRERDKTDKPYGKTAEYDYGTVAPIEIANRKAYFVAIARLNKHRVARSDRKNFLDALGRLWAEIRSRGGFDPICCPILGSRYSRLNLTREELIREIIKSFVAATLEAKFSEKLTIVVHTNDHSSGLVDLEKIERFLENECVYGRSETIVDRSGPVGTELS